MHFLLLGENFAQKEKKLAELKIKFLPEENAQVFDYEVLHAAKLDPLVLQEKLAVLPSVAKKRLLLLRGCENLKPVLQEFLLKFLGGAPEHVVLVLDSDSWTPADRFVQKLKPFAEVLDSGQAKKTKIFDLTNALERKRQPQALQLLADLLSEGVHPLQVLGTLVWFWGTMKGRVSAKKFEEGLLALQDADINIKRSRMDPVYTVEVLVVKLGQLL